MTEGHDFPEEGIRDIADRFDKLASSAMRGGHTSNMDALAKLAQIAKIHDIDSDDRIDFIMAGYDRFMEREQMNARSELRESLEQMEALFND